LPIQDLPEVRLGGRNTGYVDVQEPLIDTIRRQANRTRAKSEWWAEYKKHYPQLAASKVYVSFDEWSGGGGAGMRGNLSIAMNLQELFRHTDFIKKSAFTMGLTWLSYNRTQAVLSGAGMVFQLYHNHFGSIPVEVGGNSPQPAPKWPVGGDQPRVNAGSPTYPLDVSAALTEDRKTLTVAVINAAEAAQTLGLNLQNFRHGRRGRLWRLTGTSLDAVNLPGQAPQVTVAQAEFDASARQLVVPPYSITVHAFSSA
jgi:alpha-N-arabinofuranosidase